MQRREFIALLGGTAASSVASPLAARAQQAPLPIVGFVSSATPDGYAPMLAGFRAGLKEIGFIDGENVAPLHGMAFCRSPQGRFQGSR